METLEPLVAPSQLMQLLSLPCVPMPTLNEAKQSDQSKTQVKGT